jgi:hypothetical protein
MKGKAKDKKKTPNNPPPLPSFPPAILYFNP